MRFFDFFSGIGGFRLGMEMAGHVCVGHCEIDKYANESYKAMHHPKESEVFFEDVRTINAADMPECECYCFGFPCQAFSIAGSRNGFRDTRGTLIFEILRLAKERHPKILFGENVSGLLNHEGGWTFKTIISAMGELGYFVEWQVLNSSNFGIPQNRERVFIVGHYGGEPRRKVFPIGSDSQQAVELQGHNSFISNTLKVGGNETVGTYPVDFEGGVPSDSESERVSQEVVYMNYRRIDKRNVEVAKTLCARDYKGFGTGFDTMNAVIVQEK